MIQFAPVSVAAFVAGVSERDVHRIFDEEILPPEVTVNPRALTPLGCVLASFYFHEADILHADIRRKVVRMLSSRESKNRTWAEFRALGRSNWNVELGTVSIHLWTHVQETSSRLASLEKAEALVVSSPEVLGGEPVFKNTRVPVRTISAWVDAGVEREIIRQAYPHITDEMIAVAPAWAKTHPVRGRPRNWGQSNPDWVLKSTSTRKLREPASKTHGRT